MHNLADAPQLVKIVGVDSGSRAGRFKYCPYHIIYNYLALRNKILRAQNKGLFIYRDGRPVRAQDFRFTLKRAIKSTGLDESNYDTHSLRISRAKDLQKSGMSVEDIMQMG